jgi:hypothetical protein
MKIVDNSLLIQNLLNGIKSEIVITEPDSVSESKVTITVESNSQKNIVEFYIDINDAEAIAEWISNVYSKYITSQDTGIISEINKCVELIAESGVDDFRIGRVYEKLKRIDKTYGSTNGNSIR